MGNTYYKDASRTNWRSEVDGPDGSWPGIERVNAGSLARIADACELMAKDREEMERALAWKTKLAERRLAELETERNRVAGLRGYIKRLKKKLAAAEGGE